MRNLIDRRVGQKIAKAYSVLDTLTSFATGKSGTNLRVVTVLAAECALLTWLYSHKLLTRTPAERAQLEAVHIEPAPTLAEQISEREQQKIDDIISLLAEKNAVCIPSEVECLVRLGYTSIDIYTILYSLSKSKYSAATRQAILAGLNNKDLGPAKPFKTKNSLYKHAQNHSEVFGFITPTEYEVQAMKFMSGPLAWHVMQLERPNGEYVRWNSLTGQFGVSFKDSRLKTYFLSKPFEEGYKYFLEQHFRDDEEAQKRANEQTGMRPELFFNELKMYKWYRARVQRLRLLESCRKIV